MRPLSRWMIYVLRFAACFNVLAGLGMIFFYHELLKTAGIAKPSFVLPIQVTGALVLLFGIGYWLVSEDPVGNRHLLTLGFLSKLFGSLLAAYHTYQGNVHPSFMVTVFFADIIYLPLFWLIMRRIAGASRA